MISRFIPTQIRVPPYLHPFIRVILHGPLCNMIYPNVTPKSPVDEQPTIGLIGMGAMGQMYARYLSAAGWKK
jgi:hypothetical protein